MRNSCRTWCGLLIPGVLVLLVAVLATRDLPHPRVFEARYEFRIRDYQKNIDQPEAVLNGLELMDSYALAGALAARAANADIRCDKTEKITLCVRHAQAAEAAQQAAELFRFACDTVASFGDQMCLRKAAEYQSQIDSLSMLPVSDSTQSLLLAFRDRLAILQSDAAGGMKYIEVLNPAEAGKAVPTARRWLVVLLSVLASAILSLALMSAKKLSTR